MTSLSMSMFASRGECKRAQKRAAVAAHNNAYEEKLKRRFPIVRDPSLPVTPELVQPQGYTKPHPISLLTALAWAVVARAVALPMRYHGYEPRGGLSPRGIARAAGYSNMREKVAFENAERLKREAEAQAQA